MTDRPDGACLTHRPPAPDRAWRRADPGYRTCSECYDRLHALLSVAATETVERPDGSSITLPASIPGLYAALNPLPGRADAERRGHGFGPRSPASDHVIAMRDARSVKLLAGDPHSVAGVLGAWCALLAEERGMTPPGRGVLARSEFLDGHLDWLTRQDWVAELFAELREVHAQLRQVTGEPRSAPVGHCFEQLADGECGAPIHMPSGMTPAAPDEPVRDLPELRCPACNTSYNGRRLILLKLAEERRAS